MLVQTAVACCALLFLTGSDVWGSKCCQEQEVTSPLPAAEPGAWWPGSSRRTPGAAGTSSSGGPGPPSSAAAQGTEPGDTAPRRSHTHSDAPGERHTGVRGQGSQRTKHLEEPTDIQVRLQRQRSQRTLAGVRGHGSQKTHTGHMSKM